MREQLHSWGQYAILTVLVIVIIVPALLILFSFLLISGGVILFTSIPAWVGGLFPIDDWIRTRINRWLDIHRMQAFRDDLLHTFRRHMHIDENLDREWMLQEMDDAVDRIDKKLRNGEVIVAITAAIASIVLSIVASAQYAGLLLTIFAIIISLATFVRIVIVEILAYDAELFLEASHEDVTIRMGWNRGPINGRGAILTALGTVVVGVGDRGYQLGKWVLEEWIAERFSDTESRWSA